MKRALGRQVFQIQRFDGARGLTEADHEAEGPEAVERFHECGLADRIVDHGQAFAAGDFRHPLDEILIRVVDDMIAAMAPGEFGLGFAADGADDRGAQMFRPLTEDETDAAGGGVNQDRVRGGNSVTTPAQILGGQALQHHRRGLVGGDVVGQLDQAVGGDETPGGISAEDGRVSDPVAGLNVTDAVADGFDRSGRFHAEGHRHGRDRVETPAVIDVDEIEADGRLVQQRFTRAGGADLDVLVSEHLGPAGFVNADRLGHRFSSRPPMGNRDASISSARPAGARACARWRARPLRRRRAGRRHGRRRDPCRGSCGSSPARCRRSVP